MKEKKYTVKVPATTANLGPGFDSLGIALSLYNKTTITLEKFNSGFSEDNLIYSSFLRFYDVIGKTAPYIKMEQNDNIPQSRGLGSSAACIVTGLSLANLISEADMNPMQLLSIANSIEGHPDNVAPAIMGGLVANVVEDLENSKVVDNNYKSKGFNPVYSSKTDIPLNIVFAVFSPSFILETKVARGVLPETFSRADAIFNISRASLLVSSILNGHFDNIEISTQDRLHQPYRMDLIPGMSDIFKLAKEAGALGTFLSGAGPSCISILQAKDAVHFNQVVATKLKETSKEWTFQILHADNKGVTHEIS